MEKKGIPASTLSFSTYTSLSSKGRLLDPGIPLPALPSNFIVRAAHAGSCGKEAQLRKLCRENASSLYCNFTLNSSYYRKGLGASI